MHKAADLLEPLFQRDSGLTPDLLRPLCLQLLLKSWMALTDGGTEPELPTGFGDESVGNQLNQLEDISQLKAYTIEVLQKMLSAVEEKRSGRERTEAVERMLAFIEDNYSRSDLSLNLLADRFELSLSYLSRLFKEQVGTNFMDYLIQIRMNAAKRLLTETDRRIAEIGESIGYTNTYSFIRIFKKHTGMTPGEFRDTRKA